jgi:hypothetical protein
MRRKKMSEQDFAYIIFLIDDINVQSEETVFEAFLSWIDYDSKRQTDRLGQVFNRTY